MRAKISSVKIAIVALFAALFAVSILFPSALKTSALQSAANDAGNSQTCAACHQETYDSSHFNNHQKSVRRVSAETVKGDFAIDNHLESADVNASMTSDGTNFTVKIGDENYRVVWVVGVKYIEQYVAEKDGEFYTLPVVYDLKSKRWMSLGDTVFQKKDADFKRHLENWKTDCTSCHQPNASGFSADAGDSGISCAACHGNAAEHTQSENSIWARLGFETENKIINPRKLSSDAAMMVCGQCHARESHEFDHELNFEQLTGDQIYDAPVVAHQTNADDLEKYWANGASKFSGNEYQSLLRSVCYRQSKAGGHGIAGEKINCAICHSPGDENRENVETAAISKPPNQNCVQCHAQFADDSALVEHTKHPLGSAASSCASCHQPETVYGRLRFYATHEISVPNPSLTVEKQIPNACNLCHLNQSVNWAIASSKKLWSERFQSAEISPDKQFDQPEGVRALSSDDEFLRALTIDALRKHSGSDWSRTILSLSLISEKNALVRHFITAALNADSSEKTRRR